MDTGQWKVFSYFKCYEVGYAELAFEKKWLFINVMKLDTQN